MKRFTVNLVKYTCTSARRVVLDLVQDANAVTFIKTYERIFSTKGCSAKIMYSIVELYLLSS